NTSFYFAPDKYYGPANDLKRFIDECHKRGIAVIMDIVLNHSYGQSPLVRLYWDSANNRPSSINPWYNQVSPNPIFYWGYDFNHESLNTQEFVDCVTSFWLTEYKMDGFRFDFTKGFTNKSGDGWAYDVSRIAILERIADEIWEVDSTAYVILEHFAENSEEKVLSDYGMMLWGNSNWNYAQASMGYVSESDFRWGYYNTRGWNEPNLVTYMESHDEQRLMYKNLQWGNHSGDYDIRNLATALNRIKLAAGFFFILPGPKMIWQFGELGYDISIDDPCRVCEKPIKWEYFGEENRRNLYKTFAALIKLRRENVVFTAPNSNAQLSFNGTGKRIVMSGSPNVVIIGNFGVISQNIVPNFQHGGQWYDYFSGDTFNVVNTTESISLEAGQFHIFTDIKLETPEQGILSDIEPYRKNTPERFYLGNNYPNPFNSSTTFEYELDIASNVEIKIFDLLGREIFITNQGYQNSGLYRFSWDGKDSNGLDVQSG
ncbi:MAG: T9SS type A sorting domain-containing protein, partial [Candidatus Marinimicrobia bacterium]|nr:T9SS type A sorting domain-containing protein [Candidatus Neomarinimicrobiota bacterium]